MLVEFPTIDTVWLNLKKQEQYKIWAIAHEDNAGFRVIYQKLEIPKPDNIIYPVLDSEVEGRLGSVYLAPVYRGFVWRLYWHKTRVVEGVTALAWARPVAMWHKKFQQVYLAESAR